MRQSVAGVFAIAAAASALMAAAPARAAGGCDLLPASDKELAALLGATPTAEPQGDGCRYKANGHTFSVKPLKSEGAAAEAAYQGSLVASKKSAGTQVESGIGEQAYSAITTVGTQIVALKKGRVLNIMYLKMSQGTPDDLKITRSLARKIVSAY